MAIKCKHCEETKDESLMALRVGQPSQVCLECKQSRASLGAGAPKKKQKRKQRPDVDEQRLTMPGGGHGFDAFVTEDDQLQISQENDGEDADNLVLSKAEARLIFEKFGEWAAES